MEVFFKLTTELIQTTKAFWLVLLGAGIAIIAHNRTTKLTNESNQRERKKQLSIETNREIINALKQLYELIHEITSLHSMYMARVKYTITRKQRNSLPDDAEEIKLKIIEKFSKASMLVQFYVVEKNVTFNHYQHMVIKGLRIWDAYQLVENTNDSFIHRLTMAHLELINKNHERVKQYETALSFHIGNTGRKYIYSSNPYDEELEQIGL
jgi:archaellum component FlaG (FlaF/FlaG flagellin family)